MKNLQMFLLVAGLIVTMSFVAPRVHKVNKEFFTTGRLPFKALFRYVAVGILAMLCFVIFAILLLIFLK
jgi:hypothetical protein